METEHDVVVAARIEAVLSALGMTPRSLVSALGVRPQRVGRVTALSIARLGREDLRPLVEKLHVRSEFLTKGELPVLQSDGERAFHGRVLMLRQATLAAQRLELDSTDATGVRDLLFAAALEDRALALRAIETLKGSATSRDAASSAIGGHRLDG